MLSSYKVAILRLSYMGVEGEGALGEALLSQDFRLYLLYTLYIRSSYTSN